MGWNVFKQREERRFPWTCPIHFFLTLSRQCKEYIKYLDYKIWCSNLGNGNQFILLNNYKIRHNEIQFWPLTYQIIHENHQFHVASPLYDMHNFFFLGRNFLRTTSDWKFNNSLPPQPFYMIKSSFKKPPQPHYSTIQQLWFKHKHCTNF